MRSGVQLGPVLQQEDLIPGAQLGLSGPGQVRCEEGGAPVPHLPPISYTTFLCPHPTGQGEQPRTQSSQTLLADSCVLSLLLLICPLSALHRMLPCFIPATLQEPRASSVSTRRMARSADGLDLNHSASLPHPSAAFAASSGMAHPKTHPSPSWLPVNSQPSPWPAGTLARWALLFTN